MKSITVEELKARQDGGAPFFLLDVREPNEVALKSIPGSVNIPMNHVERRLRELPKDREIVVMCQAGGRSARVTETLNRLGYEKAVNLTGGIAAWSRRIDVQAPAGGAPLSGLWKKLFGSKSAQ
jgi:rhodanese-related sulfurtransferase